VSLWADVLLMVNREDPRLSAIVDSMDRVQT